MLKGHREKVTALQSNGRISSLKTSAKGASEKIVCCIALLVNGSIDKNSVDQDQTAHVGAVGSRSILFVKEFF